MILTRWRGSTGQVLGALAMVVAALGPAATPAPAQPNSSTLTYQLAGGNRTVLLTDYGQGRRVPLVIVLHGDNGSSEQIRRYLAWDEVGEREKLLVAYPQGMRGTWNDGRPTDGRRFNPLMRVDDVGFIRNLVEDLAAKGRIDRRRVYLVGVSSGGHMTNRLICEAGELFAAAAPLIATMSIVWGRACRGQPLPVMLVNGTQDRLTAFQGQGASASDPDTAMLSAMETFAFFRARNGCSSYGERYIPRQGSTEPPRVMVLDGTGCRLGVRFYRVEGGGHHTPTRSERRMRPVVGAMLGEQNHDFETDEELWVFFSDKQRP